MDYICENTNEVACSYPIGEVVPQIMLCTCCGKYHPLKRGKLSDEDLEYIERIRVNYKKYGGLQEDY